jgi:hypothetical protein
VVNTSYHIIPVNALATAPSFPPSLLHCFPIICLSPSQPSLYLSLPSISLDLSPCISGSACEAPAVPVRDVLEGLGVSVSLRESEVHTVHVSALVTDADHEVCLCEGVTGHGRERCRWV